MHGSTLDLIAGCRVAQSGDVRLVGMKRTPGLRTLLKPAIFRTLFAAVSENVHGHLYPRRFNVVCGISFRMSAPVLQAHPASHVEKWTSKSSRLEQSASISRAGSWYGLSKPYVCRERGLNTTRWRALIEKAERE
eukprot:431813-Pleurochrysis_carterae.AAC.1